MHVCTYVCMYIKLLRESLREAKSSGVSPTLTWVLRTKSVTYMYRWYTHNTPKHFQTYFQASETNSGRSGGNQTEIFLSCWRNRGRKAVQMWSRVGYLDNHHRARTEKGVESGEKRERREMQSKDLLKNILNCKLQLKNSEALTTQKNSASFLETLFKEEFPVLCLLFFHCLKTLFLDSTWLNSRACVHGCVWILCSGTQWCWGLTRSWGGGGKVGELYRTDSPHAVHNNVGTEPSKIP